MHQARLKIEASIDASKNQKRPIELSIKRLKIF
jgi:hypothetical protein